MQQASAPCRVLAHLAGERNTCGLEIGSVGGVSERRENATRGGDILRSSEWSSHGTSSIWHQDLRGQSQGWARHLCCVRACVRVVVFAPDIPTHV